MTIELKANALCLLSEAKNHLSIATINTNFDNRIKMLINSASKVIERICDRQLTTQSYSEFQDGRGSNRLLLGQWPVTGGPATGNKPRIWIDAQSNFGPETELGVSEYHVDKGIEIVLVGRMFPRGYRNIKIEYEAGYGEIDSDVDENTLPSDLVFCCLELVSWYYVGGTDQRIGQKSKGKSGETVAFETLLPEHIGLMLDPYRRHEFAPTQASVRND